MEINKYEYNQVVIARNPNMKHVLRLREIATRLYKLLSFIINKT